MKHPQSTIFALSSGAGRAGVAVVRLSGPHTRFALETMVGKLPPERRATLQSIRDRHGETIDQGLVLWFPGPQSFTGEDSAEFHVHGSAAVIQDVLEALGCLEGLQPAEAGEFARRAFDHGKLDLTAVEGLADLIDAETTAQRRAALRQADGGLQERYDAWREELVRAMALVEAAIDFIDEGDVAETVSGEAIPVIESIRQQIEAHLSDSARARGLRRGLTLCLAGPPNVGKSSLMNWLAARDVSIVDAEAGTTRDRLEARIVIAGVPVTVVDTAGVRSDPGSRIESEGIARALQAMESADIVIVMESPESGDAGFRTLGVDGAQHDSATVQIRVLNKVDLVPREQVVADDRDGVIKISVRHGTGLEALHGVLEAVVARRAGLTEDPVATRLRHVELLDRALDSLARCAEASILEHPEIVAEHLRAAAGCLGRLTGRIDVEDVLGAVFSEFCVGK
jgi:tRNA modification GTPase